MTSFSTAITISGGKRESSLTMEELKEKAIEQVKSSKAYHDKSHRFNDTWFSTSISTPTSGGIYAEVDENDLIQVEFKDKYKNVNVGYLVGFSYEKHIKEVTATVLVRDFTGILTDGCFNCLVRIKNLKSDRKIVAPIFDIKL